MFRPQTHFSSLLVEFSLFYLDSRTFSMPWSGAFLFFYFSLTDAVCRPRKILLIFHPEEGIGSFYSSLCIVSFPSALCL